LASYAADAVAITGLAATYHAAASTDKLQQNDGRVVLIVKNTSGSPINCTVDDGNSQTPVGASAFNPDVVVSVPATTGERWIGPLPPSRFNDANGDVNLAFSATSGVTWAAVRLP
jgi:hypothetical protein